MRVNKVILIDDDKTIFSFIKSVMKDENCNIEHKLTGIDGLKAAHKKPSPDLILLDINLPDIKGFEVCKRLKRHPETEKIPIIFITGTESLDEESYGLELGANDYIHKPLNSGLTRIKINHQLRLNESNLYIDEQKKILNHLIEERTQSTELIQQITIECMASLAEQRDNDSDLHVTRIRNYLEILCENLQQKPQYKDYLSTKMISLISNSAMLHDIGKVGISDDILKKSETLTETDIEAMKKHTTIGRDALKEAEKLMGSNSFLKFASEIAYSHHERWDGSGYPEGLKEREIPLSGRLTAIADVYDNLICDRAYKEPYKHAKAVEMILSQKGTHFDPIITECFLECEDQIRSKALELAENDKQREALS